MQLKLGSSLLLQSYSSTETIVTAEISENQSSTCYELTSHISLLSLVRGFKVFHFTPGGLRSLFVCIFATRISLLTFNFLCILFVAMAKDIKQKMVSLMDLTTLDKDSDTEEKVKQLVEQGSAENALVTEASAAQHSLYHLEG